MYPARSRAGIGKYGRRCWFNAITDPEVKVSGPKPDQRGPWNFGGVYYTYGDLHSDVTPPSAKVYDEYQVRYRRSPHLKDYLEELSVFDRTVFDALKHSSFNDQLGGLIKSVVEKGRKNCVTAQPPQPPENSPSPFPDGVITDDDDIKRRTKTPVPPDIPLTTQSQTDADS
ncbi:hypothetical protein ONZ45_g11480 [Pleurotus djamor]|nr:hypothetical protein ONZ45_g11480 [Pleurotus djamor]